VPIRSGGGGSGRGGLSSLFTELVVFCFFCRLAVHPGDPYTVFASGVS
jgi:hypothetical protein